MRRYVPTKTGEVVEPKRLVADIDGIETQVFVTEQDGEFSASTIYSAAQGCMLRTSAQAGSATIQRKTFIADTEAEVTAQIEDFLKKLGKDIGPLREAPPRPDWETAYKMATGKQPGAGEA